MTKLDLSFCKITGSWSRGDKSEKHGDCLQCYGIIQVRERTWERSKGKEPERSGEVEM